MPDAVRREPRITAFYLIIAVAFLILLGQLWNIQIANSAQYRRRADVNRIRVQTDKPPRGVIYDRAGRQLVRNVPSWTASIRPADLPRDKDRQTDVFERLGRIVGRPPDEIRRIVDEARRDPFTPVPIKPQISRDQALIIEERHTELPGVVAAYTPVRQYTEGVLFGHLLGYTGPVPSTLLDALLAQGYSRDDTVGLAGVEASFEDVLRGAPGKKQIEVDAMGRMTAELETLVPMVPGGNLVLTLDADFQRRTAEILGQAMARARSSQAAAVALQPQTGEVLAMVSLPQYDNNLFAAGISEADYRRLSEDRWRPLVNHAIAGQYPPGSTFKMVTAAAALQERIVTPQTRINCPGYLAVPGGVLTDWTPRGHGNVNVVQALATSCDIYFWSLAGGNQFAGVPGVRIDRLAEYARLFGFGEKTGLRLPGEVAGLMPTREWKRQRNEPWYLGDDYNVGIGQGDVLTTPLQLANMTAAIANGGTLYRPRVVAAVRGSDGGIVRTFEPEIIRKLPINPEYLAALRAGMRDAVALPEGTATFALRSYAALSIAGKTGSAEFGAPDAARSASGKLPSHALFVGYAPYENPQIAVAVVVYAGGEGSEIAAPAAAEIMKAYFGLQGR